MRKFSLVLMAISLTSLSWSQSTEWVLYENIDGVNVFTKEVDCYAKNIPDQKAVLIKVENTTNDACTIEWDEVIWYNGIQHTKNLTDGENHATVELEKKQTKSGDCEVPRGALYIFSDFITYDSDTKLSKFELQNIKVTRL